MIENFTPISIGDVEKLAELLGEMDKKTINI